MVPITKFHGYRHYDVLPTGDDIESSRESGGTMFLRN